MEPSLHRGAARHNSLSVFASRVQQGCLLELGPSGPSNPAKVEPGRRAGRDQAPGLLHPRECGFPPAITSAGNHTCPWRRGPDRRP